MPPNVPATTIRIESEVKKEVSAILDELGLSMSSAINMLLRAVIREVGVTCATGRTSRRRTWTTGASQHRLYLHCT